MHCRSSFSSGLGGAGPYPRAGDEATPTLGKARIYTMGILYPSPSARHELTGDLITITGAPHQDSDVP